MNSWELANTWFSKTENPKYSFLFSHLSKSIRLDSEKPMGPKLNDLTPTRKGRILQKLDSGFSCRDIATELGTSKDTVHRLKRKFEESGSVARTPWSGRPRKTTERQDRMIVKAIKLNHDITSEELIEELVINQISERTVRRRIGELSEYKSYWKVKKPFISEKNRKIRVEWARERVNWPVEQLRKWVFSDESPYVLRFACRSRVWRTHNDRYAPWATKATVKHDKKINVWGCIYC